MKAGSTLRDNGRYLEAVNAYRTALEVAGRASEPAIDRAATLVAIGWVRQLQGHAHEAEHIWLEVMKHSEGLPASLRANTRLLLGDVYMERHRYRMAGETFSDCLNDFETNQEQQMVPRVLTRIADAYTNQSRYLEALPLLKRAMELLDHAEVPGIDLAIVLHTLANVYSRLGNVYEADRLFERSLAMGESLLGGEDPRLAKPLMVYARHLRRTKRKQFAKEIEARATDLSARAALLHQTVNVNALRSGR
ncbi:MAG: tetratricopeptide repeat protein [Bryobacteraceae bacterium]